MFRLRRHVCLRLGPDLHPGLTPSNVKADMAPGTQVHGPMKFQSETSAPQGICSPEGLSAQGMSGGRLPGLGSQMGRGLNAWLKCSTPQGSSTLICFIDNQSLTLNCRIYDVMAICVFWKPDKKFEFYLRWRAKCQLFELRVNWRYW